MKTGINQAIGKTIIGAVVVENPRPPRKQLFLQFSDSTYLELYGEDFTCAAGVDTGGADEILKYAAIFNGSATQI